MFRYYLNQANLKKTKITAQINAIKILPLNVVLQLDLHLPVNS